MEIIEKLILYYYTFKIDVMDCTNVFFLFCKMEIETNVTNVTTTKYNYISKYGIILVKSTQWNLHIRAYFISPKPRYNWTRTELEFN